MLFLQNGGTLEIEEIELLDEQYKNDYMKYVLDQDDVTDRYVRKVGENVARVNDDFAELHEEILDIRENWDEEMNQINEEIRRKMKDRGMNCS